MAVPLRQVYQVDSFGCFVACVAMLTGATYARAVRMVHPNWRKGQQLGIPTKSSLAKLRQLGFKNAKRRPLQSIHNLNKKSLLIIRWDVAPTLTHAVIWCPKTKKIYDPVTELPISEYQRQLDSIIVLE